MIEIFYFDNGVKSAKVEELSNLREFPLWIDVTGITNEEASLLQEQFSLHPLTTEDMFNNGVRIKAEEFPEYLFIVSYGIRKEKEFELIKVDSVLGNKFVITNHLKKIDATENLKKNKEKLESLFKKGVVFIFHKVIDEEVDHFFPALEKLEEEVVKLEEKSIRNPTSDLLSKILHLKRKVVLIKKYAFHQREKMLILTKGDNKFISKKAIPYMRDVYDHSVRVSDGIDNLRESISNSFDVYMSTVSNKMSEVMKVLSIIATIALPLTVISGIYGTNFITLPGSGFMYGFWIMIFLMMCVSFGMIFFFRKRGWF